MKKLGKFKVFILLIFFAVILVFAGINLLEAKKPPKWEWKIEIPTSGTDPSLNVHGDSPTIDGAYAVFKENDFVKMDVQRSEHSETGEIFYHVYLRVYSNSEGYSIGFKNLDFRGCQIGCDDCWCCVFPPAELPVEVPCSELEPNCFGVGGTGYTCMEDFMENDHPNWGYEVIAIRMYIFCDIENDLVLPPGSSVTADGQMWSFDIWNTEAPLIEGNEEYHNIVCRYLHYQYDEGVNNLEDVEIRRSPDGNTWTVIVNQDGTSSSIPDLDYKLLGFREFYKQGVYKERGNSGKYFLESENRIALAARTVFKFESKWTRFKTK